MWLANEHVISFGGKRSYGNRLDLMEMSIYMLHNWVTLIVSFFGVCAFRTLQTAAGDQRESYACTAAVSQENLMLITFFSFFAVRFVRRLALHDGKISRTLKFTISS